MFLGRTDVEGETPILWPPDAKHQLIGKDPDDGKDSGQEEKGATEDKMVGWHHQLDGHSLSKLQEIVTGREGWRAAVYGVAKRHDSATEQKFSLLVFFGRCLHLYS